MRHELLLHKGDTSHELLRIVKEYIDSYPNGVVVTVSPYCMTRTKKQNGYYQQLVRRISAQTGIQTDLLKRMAKEKAIGYGYPVERDEDGEPIMRYGSLVPKSTKDVSINQLKILIRVLREIALEHDVIIEDEK